MDKKVMEKEEWLSLTHVIIPDFAYGQGRIA
jgi:hypothetical protein